MSKGREFQIVGAATEKLLEPKDVRTRGTGRDDWVHFGLGSLCYILHLFALCNVNMLFGDTDQQVEQVQLISLCLSHLNGPKYKVASKRDHKAVWNLLL